MRLPNRTATTCVAGALLMGSISAGSAGEPTVPLTSQTILAPTQDAVGPGTRGAATARAQILLDRARFSPGEIDGAYGSNLRSAIAGFQKSRHLQASGIVDVPTWNALQQDGEPALASYRITAEDLAGPFAPLPRDMMEKSRLEALRYSSAAEALGERFHVNPGFLQQINKDRDLGKLGEEILVPNVHVLPGKLAADRVVVDRSAASVSLLDASGQVLAQFPASTGSTHDPLPIGHWKVKGVARNPEFKYNPNLFWDADRSHSRATIPPGPNNPVGVVWVDLSKAHYGIHGSPEPSKIGKTESHGCIRLTNWDANTLAESVSPGMAAILQP